MSETNTASKKARLGVTGLSIEYVTNAYNDEILMNKVTGDQYYKNKNGNLIESTINNDVKIDMLTIMNDLEQHGLSYKKIDVLYHHIKTPVDLSESISISENVSSYCPNNGDDAGVVNIKIIPRLLALDTYDKVLWIYETKDEKISLNVDTASADNVTKETYYSTIDISAIADNTSPTAKSTYGMVSIEGLTDINSVTLFQNNDDNYKCIGVYFVIMRDYTVEGDE